MHAHELWQKDYLIQDSEIVYGNVSSKKRIFNFSFLKKIFKNALCSRNRKIEAALARVGLLRQKKKYCDYNKLSKTPEAKKLHAC
jgi:hypothetical protein